LDSLLQDVRLALRGFSRNPGFVAVVTVTLALGIGANTAIFSVVEALLLRPLPFAAPERLVVAWQTVPGEPTRTVAPANFLDWRANSRSFAGLAASARISKSVGGGSGEPVRVEAASVSANFFDVLGVRPLLGRGFTDEPGTATNEAVLSQGLWKERFGGEASVLGRVLRFDDEPYTVVGVLPAEARLPGTSAVWLRARDDIPEPRAHVDADLRSLRDFRYLTVVGRLAPGMTLQAAQSEMDGVAKRLEKTYPEENADVGVNLVRLHEQLVGNTRPALLLLLGSVFLVLLVACVNIANLLLARAVRRGKEVAIRASLGARRGRIVRQLLTESALLGLLGGGLGLAFAGSIGRGLYAWLPADTPRLGEAGLSLPVLAFTLGLCLLSSFLFGLVPAVQVSRENATSALREVGRTSTASPSRDVLRSLLVVGEVALALVLVTGAGLLVKSLWRLQHTRTGLDEHRVLTARVSVPGAQKIEPRAPRRVYAQVVERLAALPGVSEAGAAQALPFQGRCWNAGLRIEGRATPNPREIPETCWCAITPGYFRALGVPLVRGRALADSDGEANAAVALVNTTLARTLFPGEDPIGRRIGTDIDGAGTPVTIVGVVGDVPQESVGAPARPEMYRPLAQDSMFSGESIRVALRTDGRPSDLAASLRHAVHAVRPDLPVSDVATLDTLGRESVARHRSTGRMLSLFAATALLLAAVGLYGVLSCLVSERAREIGVRLTLGATPGDVIRLVLGRTARLVVLGTAVGFGAALLLNRFLASFLFDVTATDPMTFGAVAGLLALAAGLASYLPARRATRIDPIVVLRSE
jgi:putative ABC transport system permease protein